MASLVYEREVGACLRKGSRRLAQTILAKLHLNNTSPICQRHTEITQLHTLAALIKLSKTAYNLLTFNISEILSNNSEKLTLLAYKHLWTFLSHTRLMQVPGCGVTRLAGNT